MRLKNNTINIKKLALFVTLAIHIASAMYASPGESTMKLSNINFSGESRNIESILLKLDNFLLHIAKNNDVKIIRKNKNIKKKFFIVKSFHYEYVLSVNNDYKLYFDIYADKNKSKLNYIINTAVSWVPDEDSDIKINDLLKDIEEQLYLYSQNNKWKLYK